MNNLQEFSGLVEDIKSTVNKVFIEVDDLRYLYEQSYLLNTKLISINPDDSYKIIPVNISLVNIDTLIKLIEELFNANTYLLEKVGYSDGIPTFDRSILDEQIEPDTETLYKLLYDNLSLILCGNNITDNDAYAGIDIEELSKKERISLYENVLYTNKKLRGEL